jgi:hypothetical protein
VILVESNKPGGGAHVSLQSLLKTKCLKANQKKYIGKKVKIGENCMKKLDTGEGISNAEREEEAHGRKNTEQSKPQTKKEQSIQGHAHAHTSNAQTRNTHGKRQNATATTDFHGWISASIHLSTSSTSCWFFFHFCLFLFLLFLGFFWGVGSFQRAFVTFF